MKLSATLNIQFTPPLTQREFDLLSRLIYERSGIHLGDHKQALLRARLSRRLHDLGLSSFHEYYCLVKDHDPDGREGIHMLDAISTNLTEFFREPRHFERLSALLPSLNSEPQIRILSAGCSTGEEPYSIAICAREALGSAASRVRICACDISTRVLAQAQSGIYPIERIRNVSVERRRTSFLRGTGNSEGLVAVAPEVRALVSFQRLNLFEPLCFDAPFHMVFCRNVAIYFDKATQETLFRRLWNILAPGGTLFLGHSESMTSCKDLFEYVQPTVYRRRAKG